MAKSSPHGRILATAAKASLAPLGCKRIGQSRLWVADHRFWLIIVEFQPSGFGNGSYLNVCAMWLWCPKTHWSFDFGGRVGSFICFTDEVQFKEDAEKLARCAGEEVEKLRKLFSSPKDITSQLVSMADCDHDLPLYQAALAAGLAGDLVLSTEMFERLDSLPPAHTDWHTQLRRQASNLFSVLRERDAFRTAAFKIVQETRAVLGLPPDDDCFQAYRRTID